MKKIATFYVLLLTLFLVNIISAQNPEWINYTCGKNVISIAIEGNTVWVGTQGGLVQFDMNSENMIFYHTGNSGLPDNMVCSIVIDGSGNKWIGTWGGLAKFDGTNWTVYNASNSGLPDNMVHCIAIDGSGNKWIGTWVGLAKFDGTNWTVYKASNSRLPDDDVLSIAIDGSGNKWIGTGGNGLAKFDGTNWTVYDESNSGLPGNSVSYIAIDGSGNKWIGTRGGLAKFDDMNWTVYNTSNSGLPDNNVLSIAIDGSGNKWIGTDGRGLAVYREGGIVAVEENLLQMSVPQCFELEPNYPNPFNAATTISFALAKSAFVRLTIYDLLGKKVCTLLNKKMEKGCYQIKWEAEGLASGIYVCCLETETKFAARKVTLLK